MVFRAGPFPWGNGGNRPPAPFLPPEKHLFLTKKDHFPRFDRFCLKMTISRVSVDFNQNEPFPAFRSFLIKIDRFFAPYELRKENRREYHGRNKDHPRN